MKSRNTFEQDRTDWDLNKTVPTGKGTASTHSWVVVVVALLYILLWSSAFIATKVGVQHSPPLTLLAARFLCAAVLMALGARMQNARWPRTWRSWRNLALFGLLNSGLYLGFSYEALRHLSAGVATIIAATNPLLLALLAARILGERLSLWRVIGLVLGFGGVVFVMAARLSQHSEDTIGGMILAVAGVSCLVAATVLYKRQAIQEHPLVINAIQLGVAGIVLAVPAVVVEHPERVHIDGPVTWAFLYLVLVISIAASLLWFWLLKQGEASVVSAYYFLTPIFGLILAAVLLGEPISARDVIGLAAVATGIALINRTAISPARQVADRSHTQALPNVPPVIDHGTVSAEP